MSLGTVSATASTTVLVARPEAFTFARYVSWPGETSEQPSLAGHVLAGVTRKGAEFCSEGGWLFQVNLQLGDSLSWFPPLFLLAAVRGLERMMRRMRRGRRVVGAAGCLGMFAY